MIDFYSFLTKNGEKGLTIKAYIYSFYYRFLVMKVPMKKLQKKFGIRGEESTYDFPEGMGRYVRLCAFHVNRITEHLPWDAKCFVRALTLRKLLNENNISSTIYLGVMEEEGKLKAHAWLRCGNYYLTGGNGDGFAVVAKFRNSNT